MAEVNKPRAVHEVDLSADHISSPYDSAEFSKFVPETSATDVLETLVSDIKSNKSLREQLRVTAINAKDAAHE